MTTQAAEAVASLTLRQRILRAGGWSMAGFAASQGLRFGSNLIMTRLLAPEMWGVMSIVFMIMMGLALMLDIGLRPAVVQSRRGSDPLFLNTVWVTKIAIGAATTAVAIVIALGIAAANYLGIVPPQSTYAAPDLPYVLAVVGATGLISGFESTRTMEAGRSLSLGRLTQMGLIAQVAAIATMLLLATFTRSIWVLVAGYLVSVLVPTALSHTWLDGTPNRLRWDRQAFKELLTFGRWIFASSAIGFVASAADKAILGAFVGPATLGVYWIAVLLYSVFDQVVSKAAGELSFPAMSEVARERQRDMQRILYKFHGVIALFSYGSAAFLFVASPAIVKLLYDSRYHEAGWMLQILSLGLLAMPARAHAMCALALGNSRVTFAQSVVALLATASGMLLGFRFFGLAGALTGIVVGQLCGALVPLGFSSYKGLLQLRREALPFLAVIPGAAAGWAITRII